MDALQALVLGIVQGLTEWLPVSSSGHLVISEELLGLPAGENLVFDLVVHLGTLLAVCVYFRLELWRVIISLSMRRAARGAQEEVLHTLGLLLILGTIPAAVVGVLFSNRIEAIFDIRLVGFAMIVNAAMLFLFERIGSNGTRKTAKLLDAAVIGLFQAVAIIPGISRSGSTIGGGMIRGLERETAAVFAFLLSVPTLLGAFAYGMLTLDRFDADLVTGAIGMVTAFGTGIVSIDFLLKAVRRGKLWIFGVYCVAVGAIVVLLTL
jgi:undecaprenyl-diphosphatase